ncbi:lycopene cyclase domain-containing protein [Lutibacter maritimus]|uniref:Lycopene cyclase domain-containing protein n=1 Tax=Lutibacter maritimus TaxID=593133 RepID=A0A1I6NPC2_9FLAO|nr:lycopene cyclase domain-containing protein [Lutibacter maritimus]SFS29739.1 lycopene cyclase domain-containing protein [Lutibacter maritimus]
MSLYLVLNIASFIVPFVYSFEKKMRFIKWWKSVFLSIFIVAFFFLVWDIFFTKMGVWGFNPVYHVNFTILGLPLEEILFFICIPYASIFTHYAVGYFYPNLQLSKKVTNYITIILFLISAIVLIFNTDKWYTFINLLVFAGLLIYAFVTKNTILQKFYITFLVILIPFFIVNGILTGSFIHQEVVWYDNAENLGIRLFTIPIEDAFYAFSMLFANLILIEKFKKVFN